MASERARGIARDIRLYNRGFEVSDAWIDEHIAAIVEAERGEPSQGEGQPYAWLPGHAGGECHLCKGSIYDGEHVIGIPGRVRCPKERQERPEPGGGKG